MIYTGTITTTPGKPISLGSGLSASQSAPVGGGAIGAQSSRAAWVIIQWKSGNTGNMYVGGPTTNTPFSTNCPAITNGNSITLPWQGTPGAYGLDKILIDSDNAGAVLFIYGKG